MASSDGLSSAPPAPADVLVVQTVEHRAPPTLGQHSAEVLHELLGKSEADIARLRAAGVV